MDTKKLFQITEAAHACGISRSTLMRMEEKGLLTPVYIVPESGRRYYDNHNIACILQIEKFINQNVIKNISSSPPTWLLEFTKKCTMRKI